MVNIKKRECGDSVTCLQNNLGILKVERPFVFYGSSGGWLPVYGWRLASDWDGHGSLNGKGHDGGGVLGQDRADMALYSKRYMAGNCKGYQPYLYHNIEAIDVIQYNSWTVGFEREFR